jgi:hypothetical protein
MIAQSASVAPPLSLIPEIDSIGQYSIKTEFPVRANDPAFLSNLSPEASRRITGRSPDDVPLNFLLDPDSVDCSPVRLFLPSRWIVSHRAQPLADSFSSRIRKCIDHGSPFFCFKIITYERRTKTCSNENCCLFLVAYVSFSKV